MFMHKCLKCKEDIGNKPYHFGPFLIVEKESENAYHDDVKCYN
jgi:hypothetical protein